MLTGGHVQKLLLAFTRRGYTSKYVHELHATLSAALAFGVARKLLDENVARAVRPPRIVSPQPATMAESDLERFLAALGDPRDRALFCVELSTGMRRGELIALRWTDLDPETGKVTITRRIVRARDKGGYDYDTPKTAAGFRVVQLPPPVLEAVLAWRAQQELERRVYRRWEEGGWIFTSRQHQHPGRHLDPTSINRLLQDYLDAAGLPA